MKYVCLNIDACGFSKYVKLESLTNQDLQNPFKNCEQCKYLMVLVKDDFSFKDLEKNQSFHKVITEKNNVQ